MTESVSPLVAQAEPVACSDCNGYGRVNDGSGARSPYGPKCPRCGGSGRVPAPCAAPVQQASPGSDHVDSSSLSGETVRSALRDEQLVPVDNIRTGMMVVTPDGRDVEVYGFGWAGTHCSDLKWYCSTELRVRVPAALPSPPSTADNEVAPPNEKNLAPVAQPELADVYWKGWADHERHAESQIARMVALLRQAREALGVATTPLAKDRQEVLRAIAAIDAELPKEPTT
jgi:hypothetical protein